MYNPDILVLRQTALLVSLLLPSTLPGSFAQSYIESNVSTE